MAITVQTTRLFYDKQLEGLSKDALLRRALTGDPEAMRKYAQNALLQAQFEADATTTDATAGEVIMNIGFSATPVEGLVDFSRPVPFLVLIEDFFNDVTNTRRCYAAAYATVLGNATTPVANALAAPQISSGGTTLGGLGCSVSGGVVRAAVTGVAATNITHRFKISVFDPIAN